MDPLHEGDAEPRTSLRSSLIRFRRIFVNISHTCLSAVDQVLFTASKASVVRLRCCGISNFMPCLNSCVFIPEHTRRPLLASLLHAQQAITIRDRLAMFRDMFVRFRRQV